MGTGRKLSIAIKASATTIFEKPIQRDLRIEGRTRSLIPALTSINAENDASATVPGGKSFLFFLNINNIGNWKTVVKLKFIQIFVQRQEREMLCGR